MVNDMQCQPWVDIILVNFNGNEQICNTIDSVGKFCETGSYRITVVDNGSTDSSCDDIERRFPQVQVLRTGNNNGFGKGCNIGVRNTSAPNILLLNPDALLLTDVLTIFRSVIAEAKSGEQPILGGLSVDRNGKPTYAYERFPTPWVVLAKALGLGRWLEPSYKNKQPHRVDYVSGSLLLIGREEFERLQGFDESFFLYFEETDLQYRARQLGIFSVHVPAALYLHESGGTFTDASFRGQCYSNGMRRYLQKRYGAFGIALHKTYYIIHGTLTPLKKVLKSLLSGRR